MATALERRCCPDAYPISSNSWMQIEQNRPWSHDEARQIEQVLRGHIGARQTLDSLEQTEEQTGSVGHSYDIEELESIQPLPYCWEKCLDLQTGAMYYRNRLTRTRIQTDPREGDDIPYFFRKQASTKKGEDCDETVMNEGTLELTLNMVVNSFTSKVSLQAVSDKIVSSHENTRLATIQVDTAAANISSCSNSARERSIMASPASLVISQQDLDAATGTTSRGIKRQSGELSNHDLRQARAHKEEEIMKIVGCPACLTYVMLCMTWETRCPVCGNSVLVDFPSAISSNRG